MTMFNGGCPAVPSNQGEEIHYDQRVTGVNGVSLSDVAVAVLRFSCHLFFSLLLHPDSIFVLVSLCFVPFSLFFMLVLFLYFIVYSSSPLLDYFPDPFTVYAILFLSTLYTKDLNSCFHPVISLILFFPPKNPEIPEEKKKNPVN